MTNSIPQKIALGTCLLVALGAAGYAQSPENMVEDPNREARMEWWNDARFGLFIHWGLYSVPAGEWKGEISPKNYAEWAQHNFQIPVEEYAAIAEDFNPVKFDADEWAQLAADAGMGYFVLTTKHHDGFAMFDSKVTDYDIVDATPFKRDVFGELAEAFRARGMRVGAYYSQDIDWSVPQGTLPKSYNTWDFEVEEGDTKPFDKYMFEKSLPQVSELATNYGDVDVFWFDVPRTVDRERGKLFHDLVRTHQPNAVISGRIAVPQGVWADYLVPGDNGYYSSPQDFNWECCATMNESWGYTKHEKRAKSIEEIIEVLLKTISSGGNLLLNVGPKPDGTIPEDQTAILKQIAEWMKDNSEAVHGTEGNPFGEFFDFGYCTVKDNVVYMHVTEWEDGKTITVPRLQNEIVSIELLGDAERSLDWKRDGGDLTITLDGGPANSSASVIKITAAGDSLAIEPVALKEEEDAIVLESRYAKSGGQRMSTLRHYIVGGQAAAHLAGGHPSERLTWDFEVNEPGTFAIFGKTMQPERKKVLSRLAYFKFDDQNEIRAEIEEGEFPSDGLYDFGTVTFDEPGAKQLALRVEGGRANESLYLESLQLKRVE